MVRTVAFLLLASVAFAQDERRVVSPNGQIEFRLSIRSQENSNLWRIAYEVFAHGKPLLRTSYLGLDILNQEPLLGENVGLTSSASAKSRRYNSLVAKYMQNGSLGRLLNIEVRAYDDGVAFRYLIPPSTPLIELLIVEEATEFRSVPGAVFKVSESSLKNYPPMHLIHIDPSTTLTRLDRQFQGVPPLTCPWRIIALGPSIVADLATVP